MGDKYHDIEAEEHEPLLSTRGNPVHTQYSDLDESYERPAHHRNAGRSPPPEERKPYVPKMRDPMHTRQRYYDRLMRSDPDNSLQLQVPAHIMPYQLFEIVPTEAGKKSSSLSTICTIWNTMVGSTTLAVSWGFHESGYVGIILFLLIAALSYYTCTLVLKNGSGFLDFADCCREYLGRWGQYVAIISSCCVLVGALIAYQMYMSDSVWSIVGMFDPLEQSKADDGAVWDPSIPAILICALVLPLLFLKKLDVLVKFNAFGTLFVVFTILFIFVKSLTQIGESAAFKPKFYRSTFGKLGGLLALSFFIHNSVLPIMANKENQEKNGRDLFLGFLCAGLTYFIPGVLGIFVHFGTSDASFQQNFLNNFPFSDAYAFFARVSVLIQLYSVFPLLVYILRVQFYGFFLGDAAPSTRAVVLFNVVIIGISTVCTYFQASFGVGNVLRFTGAGCGMFYMYLLPVLVHWVVQYRRNQLTALSILGHSFVILIGLATLAIQFPAVLVAIGLGGDGKNAAL